jgi:hypothetical protein
MIIIKHKELCWLFILSIYPDGIFIQDRLRLKVDVPVKELEVTIAELLDSDADELTAVRVGVYSSDEFNHASHGGSMYLKFCRADCLFSSYFSLLSLLINKGLARPCRTSNSFILSSFCWYFSIYIPFVSRCNLDIKMLSLSKIGAVPEFHGHSHYSSLRK